MKLPMSATENDPPYESRMRRRPEDEREATSVRIPSLTRTSPSHGQVYNITQSPLPFSFSLNHLSRHLTPHSYPQTFLIKFPQASPCVPSPPSPPSAPSQPSYPPALWLLRWPIESRNARRIVIAHTTAASMTDFFLPMTPLGTCLATPRSLLRRSTNSVRPVLMPSHSAKGSARRVWRRSRSAKDGGGSGHAAGFFSMVGMKGWTDVLRVGVFPVTLRVCSINSSLDYHLIPVRLSSVSGFGDTPSGVAEGTGGPPLLWNITSCQRISGSLRVLKTHPPIQHLAHSSLDAGHDAGTATPTW